MTALKKLVARPPSADGRVALSRAVQQHRLRRRSPGTSHGAGAAR